MAFTAAEIRFLHSARTDKMPSLDNVDFKGCPAKIYNRILEIRAKRLGPAFEEFRKAQQAVAPDVLDQKSRLSVQF